MKKIKLFMAVVVVTSLLGITSFAAVSTLQNGAKTIDSADIVVPLNENAAILDDHIDNVAGTDTLGHIKIGDGLKTTEDGVTSIDASYLIDKIYPVGSIYMSMNNVSPESFLGGKWEVIQNKFLIGAGDTYEVNSIGGESTHLLTTAELPSNIGTFQALSFSTESAWGKFSRAHNAYNLSADNTGSDFGTANYTLSGGNQPQNNMPPYLAVYMWERTE